MRLVTFQKNDATRVGILEGGQVVDAVREADQPTDMVAFIAEGETALRAIQDVVGKAARFDVESVRILAPIPRPRRNIFCVGKNYAKHADEFYKSGFDSSSKTEVPPAPIVFSKPDTSVVGPGDGVLGSIDPTNTVDYEGELTVVIGRGGRGIAAKDAWPHVYGYTIVNDVTSRELQGRHGQWLIGKGLDTFCPMGPCIVTADEIPAPGDLRLETRINGEVRQSASIGDLIFDIPTLIETLSQTMTLLPGDLIATGTCEGVGIGFDPPKYLAPGDHMAVRIEPIGTLENTIR